MPRCVCRKVKDKGLQVNKMNENISFNMGVKSAAPFQMRMIFEMYCMKTGAKVLRMNYNNVNINKTDMRSGAKDDMYRLIFVS